MYVIIGSQFLPPDGEFLPIALVILRIALM